jgi:hypothetical protein
VAETVFYAWQADTPPATCRNFIESALQRALKQIANDAVIEPAIREDLELDKDTKGVPGTPPVVDTIFRKIDAAAVFVSDLTFVGVRKDGRPTPNPNVLIEYGWALRSLGHPHMVAVMNTAYGKPTRENLPFDLGHLRHPILYECPEGADEEKRKAAREGLSRDLAVAIRTILLSDDFKRRRSPEAKFVPHEPKEGRSRFRSKREAIGLVEWVDYEGPPDLFLAEVPAEFWLRLMPSVDHGGQFSISRLRRQVRPYGNVNALPTLAIVAGDPLCVRGDDGYGTWDPSPKNDFATGVAYAFTNGEIWMIEQRALRYSSAGNFIPLNEALWARSLAKYTEFLQQLELEPPFRWIAGVTGVKGRGLYIPGKSEPTGACAANTVEVDGFHTPDKHPGVSLEPFFAKVFDACGVERRR